MSWCDTYFVSQFLICPKRTFYLILPYPFAHILRYTLSLIIHAKRVGVIKDTACVLKIQETLLLYYKQSAKILLLPSKCEMIFVTLCSPFSYRSSNFAMAKVVALNLFA